MDSTTTWAIPMSASSIFWGDWNQLKWGNRENFAMFLGIEPTKMGKTMENNGVFFLQKKATNWFYNVLYDYFLARNLWDLTEHMISSTSDLRWRRIRFNEWIPALFFGPASRFDLRKHDLHVAFSLAKNSYFFHHILFLLATFRAPNPMFLQNGWFNTSNNTFCWFIGAQLLILTVGYSAWHNPHCSSVSGNRRNKSKQLQLSKGNHGSMVINPRFYRH